MSSILRRLALGAAPLMLTMGGLACGSADAGLGSIESPDTGWVGDTSYELGATIKSTVEQKAEGAWADLATSETLQVSLVDTQWKFAKNALKTAGYDLNQLADSVRVTDASTSNGVVKLTYEAKVDLLHELDAGTTVPTIDQVKPRTVALKLPLAPARAFADAHGTCVGGADGEPSGESNFFYYFDGAKADCKVPLVPVELQLVEVYPRNVVYPEYDQLLAGDVAGKKGFRAALVPAAGDHDPMSRFDSLKEMLESLKLTGERVLDGKALRYTYSSGKVAIVVDLFDPTKTILSAQFRSALSGYQLVFFNGHSEYGTRDLLESKEAFSSKYQIVMMHSCRSYPYYVRQIFRAKQSASDPLGWAGADVVATGESSYPADAPRTLKPLLEGLLSGMTSASSGSGTAAPSWNAMIEKMNSAAEGIMYGVAGVRTNAWKPR